MPAMEKIASYSLVDDAEIYNPEFFTTGIMLDVNDELMDSLNEEIKQ